MTHRLATTDDTLQVSGRMLPAAGGPVAATEASAARLECRWVLDQSSGRPSLRRVWYTSAAAADASADQAA